MKRWFGVMVGLSALILCMSCSPSYEGKGNEAYRAAKRASGDAKLILEKEAYIYYRKAIKAHPDRIGRVLRNRFAETTLSRANMVLTQGSSNMDALPLFIEDMDSILNADLESQFANQYADFLLLLADSNFARQKLYAGISFIEKAVAVARDPGPYKSRLDATMANLANDNLEIARMEFEEATAEKNVETLVRAEFRTKLALYYSKKPEGEQLLSSIYQANRANYSAYEAVVTDKPDTNIFKQIDKYDILFAIPEVKGGTLIVHMYNYSYNPLRMRASDFTLEDENGNKYPAATSSTIPKEILDQEHEMKLVLRFPSTPSKIKKLSYKNEEHYSEKCFY